MALLRFLIVASLLQIVLGDSESNDISSASSSEEDLSISERALPSNFIECKNAGDYMPSFRCNGYIICGTDLKGHVFKCPGKANEFPYFNHVTRMCERSNVNVCNTKWFDCSSGMFSGEAVVHKQDRSVYAYCVRDNLVLYISKCNSGYFDEASQSCPVSAEPSTAPPNEPTSAATTTNIPTQS